MWKLLYFQHHISYKLTIFFSVANTCKKQQNFSSLKFFTYTVSIHISELEWIKVVVAIEYWYLHKKEMTEMKATMRPRSNTLKYGLQSPLHDYYHFNCSRENNVRIISIYHNLYWVILISLDICNNT